MTERVDYICLSWDDGDAVPEVQATETLAEAIDIIAEWDLAQHHKLLRNIYRNGTCRIDDLTKRAEDVIFDRCAKRVDGPEDLDPCPHPLITDRWEAFAEGCREDWRLDAEHVRAESLNSISC